MRTVGLLTARRGKEYTVDEVLYVPAQRRPISHKERRDLIQCT